MPNASAGAAYDLGVKIFGRDGVPTDNGLKNLLAAPNPERFPRDQPTAWLRQERE